MSGSGYNTARRGSWDALFVTAAHATTEAYMVGSINTTTTGLAVRTARKLISVSVSGNCSATSANGTATVTVYKNSVAAGNVCFAAVSAATAVNTGIDWTTNTVANAGMDALAAGDKFIITYKCSTGTLTLQQFNIMLEWEYTDP